MEGCVLSFQGTDSILKHSQGPLLTHWLFDVQVSFLKQAISIYRLAIKSTEIYYTAPNTLFQERLLKQPSPKQSMFILKYSIGGFYLLPFPEYLFWKQNETVTVLCFLVASSRRDSKLVSNTFSGDKRCLSNL